MTYSYVHKMINKEAFPNAINLFNPEIMTGRGRGKYMYKKETREKGEEFLRKTMKNIFRIAKFCILCRNIAYYVETVYNKEVL